MIALLSTEAFFGNVMRGFGPINAVVGGRGQERSMITLLSTEAFFGNVMRGFV